jgi:maleylpyruvate isomerase
VFEQVFAMQPLWHKPDTPGWMGLMTAGTTVPSGVPYLEETVLATSRYLATVHGLTDDQARAGSLLPGWSRGHVVTHLSRNADALCNLLQWALTGDESPMYRSQEHRDADVEAGSGRRATELVRDAEHSSDRYERMARMLPADRSEVMVSRTPGSPPFPVADVGAMRWTEVEVHHADLGLGYTAADWPVELLTHLLERRQRELAEDGRDLVLDVEDLGRRVEVGDGGPTVRGAASDVVRWLLGRGDGSGLACSSGPLPELGRWR